MRINRFTEFFKKKKKDTVLSKEAFISKITSELDGYDLSLRLCFKFKDSVTPEDIENFRKNSTEDQIIGLLESNKIYFLYSEFKGVYLSFDTNYRLNKLVENYIVGEEEFRNRYSKYVKGYNYSEDSHTIGTNIRMEKFILSMEEFGVSSSDISIANKYGVNIFFEINMSENILLKVVNLIWVDLPTDLMLSINNI